MSRFTSAYHTNRPSAHQLAERQVLAVATNLNTAGSPYTDDPAFSAHAPSNSHPFGDSHDLSFSGLPSLAAFSDSPTRMPGRVATSVLGYNPFGRDGPRRRTSRWLVLVIPPSFITESQGAFGHTLSSGPSSRLSQGLLLPLYPTMYAQLTAIAREFNFPSTAGICLYMHVSEAGALFAPRISEESWGILWGHLFEPNAPNPTSGLPISGRVEFDIDVAKARWYHSWISASRRETVSLPSLSPTHVASMHQRQESKTTTNSEDVQERGQTSVATRKSTNYTPKRLSLLERFDLANSPPPMALPIPTPVPVTTSVSMPEPHPASPPAKPPVSSSIVPEEEPLKSHREEIDTRVNSWRASATFKTNLFASTGQVSLDPANMPNALPLDDPVDDDEVRPEMNPEDYSWSVTSAGPPSILDSPTSTSSYRVPSVHLDRRAIGSVPLTPETCTSWGPEDYDPLSPVSSVPGLPSPDLGQRSLEYCPMTPTTATSWGPPSEYPPSPDPESQSIYYYRAPSLDLGQRVGWSRPATPSTATSWGPPSEYPPSPPPESQGAYYRPPSVDLGRRAEGSRPVTPSTATSWGPPEEWPPTPTSFSRVGTPDTAKQRFSFAEEVRGLAPSQTVAVPAASAPWNFVWPYLTIDEQKLKPLGRAPWNYVWPYLTLDEQRSKPPKRAPWNYVWPYLMQEDSTSRPQEPREPSAVVERAAYPVLNIYPAVYPHFDVYPSIRGGRIDRRYAPGAVSKAPAIQTQGRTLSVTAPVLNAGSPLQTDRIGYPALNIYPAVYPCFEIYPKIQTVQSQVRINSGDSGQEFKSGTHSGPKEGLRKRPWGFGWPLFRPVSPPVPTLSPVLPFTSSPVPKARMVYPVINIYPAVYPFLDVYPSVERPISVQPSKPVPPQKLPAVTKKSVGMKLGYPVIKIYEAVYPHLELYPKVARYAPKTMASVRLPAVYPTFDIYPAVYPHLNIYPAIIGVSKPVHPKRVPSVPNNTAPTDGQFALGYPSLVIYPSVYPWIDVYPSIAGELARLLLVVSLRQLRTRSAPHARIKSRNWFTADESAPPVPKLPDHATLQALSQGPPSPSHHNRKLPLQEHLTNPAVSILVDPPAYPYFDIYPVVAGRMSSNTPREEQRSTTPARSTSGTMNPNPAYPRFDIYPAAHPNADVRPTIRGVAINSRVAATSIPLVRVVNASGPSYPIIQIYKPVYPHLDIYPSWSRTQGSPRHEHDARALHREVSPGPTAVGKLPRPIVVTKPSYPVVQIYNQVYPHFDIYPSWVRVQAMLATKQAPRIHKSHHELHQEVFPISPVDSAEPASQPRSAPVLSSPRYAAYPAVEIYKAAYPHFNIYPSWTRILAPSVQDPPRPKEARKIHKDLDGEVPPYLPTVIPDVSGYPKAAGGASGRRRGLTIVARQRDPIDEPALPPVPKVSPLRTRVPSLRRPNEGNTSPSRPRVSPVFDRFPSIETRLSQSEDEAASPSDRAPATLTRSQSLSQPTTPRRRQSALIAQKIKALGAAAESPEPVLDRSARGSIRLYPVSPTRV